MMLFDIGYKNIVCINNVQNNLTDRLVRHGLKVIIGHGNYTVDIKDFVIYSDIQAIIDGPETTQSRVYQQSSTKKHFHICITYNQFIAEISKRFTTISVSGSNGKTSTTAMLIYALSHLA
jgi:UDP-N-acetylmuramate-alanine ligase